MILARSRGHRGRLQGRGHRTDRTFKKINHQPTRECVDIERDFLQILEGGCSAPIGAHAIVAQDKIQFKGGVFLWMDKLLPLLPKKYKWPMVKI